MSNAEIERIYAQHIKTMSPQDRLRLLAMITHELAATQDTPPKRRSIMELHGLGKEIWEGVDAQTYVGELRKEWDHRP